MTRLRLLLVIVSFAAVLVVALTIAAEPSYRAVGKYFETCSCDPSCPCIFTSDPTKGHCKASLVWMIDEGHWGEIDLGGAVVVVTLVADGHMAENVGTFKGAIYLQETAGEGQQLALGALFTSRFGSLFGSMTEPRMVPIEIIQHDDNYAVKIPGILDAAIEPIKGPDGSVGSIEHAPFALTDKPLMVSRSVRHVYNDEGLDSWDMGAGRSGFYADFDYSN